MDRSGDQYGMECERFREALSAVIDGEVSPMGDELVAAHVRRCVACEAWAATAREQRAALVAATPTPPDLSARIARAAIRQVRAGDAPRRWRVALAVVAALHLLIALPSLLGASGHTMAELRSWDIALSIGFLMTAWRPARAWGMLPLVGAVVGGVALTGIVAPTTEADLATEAAHLLDMAGLVCVWALAGQPLPRALRPWAA